MALFSLLLAWVGPMLSASNQTRQRARFLSSHAIETLERDAGLEAFEAPSQRLPVQLVPQAGDLSHLVGVKQAVARSQTLIERQDAPNVLLVAPHRWGSVFAMELRLVREGWALRLSEMQYLVHLPWVAPAALLLACLCLLFTHSRWLVMPVAAGLSQATLAWAQRGAPWQEIPVAWTAWPSSRYAAIARGWRAIVFSEPLLSVCGAGLLLWSAYLVSTRARAQGQSWNAQRLWAGACWVAASLAWWDANLRSAIPFERLSLSGSGWMRISWALCTLAWVASGYVVFRRPQARGLGKVLPFPGPQARPVPSSMQVDRAA